jgi:hypothetical protein
MATFFHCSVSQVITASDSLAVEPGTGPGRARASGVPAWQIGAVRLLDKY